jgi:predicted nucleic acid-binding protein
MTKFVITPEVALKLASDRSTIAARHKILAPTLFRSQVLSLSYTDVLRGRTIESDARQQLSFVRKLRIRLLGDRVLQDRAWKIAADLKWPDTLEAEYIALTQLQAHAFVTLNKRLARSVKGIVTLAPVEALI